MFLNLSRNITSVAFWSKVVCNGLRFYTPLVKNALFKAILHGRLLSQELNAILVLAKFQPAAISL